MRINSDPDKPEAMYSTRMMTIGGLVALKDYAGPGSAHNAQARWRSQGEVPQRARAVPPGSNAPNWHSTTARPATMS